MSLLVILKRAALITIITLGLAAPSISQDFSGLARLDVDQSDLSEVRRGAELTLFLSQPVPYRVFTLGDPRRVILDFKELDFTGLDPAKFIVEGVITDVRFGALRPGWSRLILELEGPLAVTLAGMTVNETDGTAQIDVTLSDVTQEEFSASVGAPYDPDWAFLMEADPGFVPPVKDDGPLVVVIDPGHGGIDPGAVAGDIKEADVMLALALELAAALGRIEGVQPILTRNDDGFVPLQERLTRARIAKADLMISLHADALEGAQATGASVYLGAYLARPRPTRNVGGG